MGIFWTICIIYITLWLFYKTQEKKTATNNKTESKTMPPKSDSLDTLLSSVDETIKNADKMLVNYRVDNLKIVARDKYDTTEYILTGISDNLNRDFSWRFTLGVSDCNNAVSELHILFKNQIGKEKPVSLESIPFEHSIENFKLLNEPKKIWKNNQYEYTFATSKLDGMTKESYAGIVPTWEKVYFYSFPTSFPSKEIIKFYKFYKQEFLNGNYINLDGNDNYAFCLLYDLSNNEDKKTIQKYLPLLAEKYPCTSLYVRIELGKKNICTKTYNGRTYFLQYGYGSINIFCVKDDFQNKKEIIHWLTKTDEFSMTGMIALIDENGTVDVIPDEAIKLYGNEKRHCKVLPIGNGLPEYINFGTVEGNFYYMNTGWNSVKNRESGYKGGLIEPHDIITLQGCPETVNGVFRCEKIGLTSLKGGPKKVTGDYIARGNSLISLEGMPLEIGGDFDISNNELTDDAWEYALENIPSEVCGSCKTRGNRLEKYRCDKN